MCTVKPVFKGLSVERTPCDQEAFSQNIVLSFPCYKEPVMKGHLPCPVGMFSRVLRCLLKTGFTVYILNQYFLNVIFSINPIVLRFTDYTLVNTCQKRYIFIVVLLVTV